MDAKIEDAIEKTEIRENIGYKFLLNNRLMMVNMSFDSTDKVLIRSTLHTTFDMISPYMDRYKKCRVKKKILALTNIHDKDEFLAEAHLVYCALLDIMHDRNMLFTEIETTMG